MREVKRVVTAEIVYSTFCKALDDLFGGYRSGQLLHIYGEAKTGKTTLGFYLPSISIFQTIDPREKTPERYKFIIVSTDAGFRVSRWEELCKAHGVDFSDIYQYLMYYEPSDFNEQYRVVVKTIPSILETQGIRPLLIVLDPATILYREEWKDVSQKEVLLKARQLIPRLESQLVALLRIARKYNCVAVVTNIKKRFLGFGEDAVRRYDFYGGHAFAYLPYCCLRLEKPDKYGSEVEISVVFHRERRPGVSKLFRLSEKGFEEVE